MVAQPGSRLTLQLSIQNLNKSAESYTVVPAGLNGSWTTVERSSITLFSGIQDVIDVVVTPPEAPTTSAGPAMIAVRVVPLSEPDDAVVAEIILSVQPFDDRRIVSLQPVQRARRRATFEFMVENHGNELASCRLKLVDTSERIDGSFDPPAVGVAPGGASLVQFKAKALRGSFRRATRTLDFEVEAEQQGHDPCIASMSLVQSPTIPGAAIFRVLTVAALLFGLAAAWFSVIRPEIREAATDIVDERIARAQLPNSTTVPRPHQPPRQSMTMQQSRQPTLATAMVSRRSFVSPSMPLSSARQTPPSPLAKASRST